MRSVWIVEALTGKNNSPQNLWVPLWTFDCVRMTRANAAVAKREIAASAKWQMLHKADVFSRLRVVKYTKGA